MGIKLLTIGILALLMSVPAWFVDRLVEDRSRRAAEVSQSIGNQLGGAQAFLGPVLAVPYATPKPPASTYSSPRAETRMWRRNPKSVAVRCSKCLYIP